MTVSYLADRIGSAVIEPHGPFVAGAHQPLTLTYTAGFFGIDDTGSLKVVWRFASDMGRPQFDDPAAPNYVTVEASNGAVLDVRFDPKQNERPWDRTLYVKVVRGFLREGDRITIRLGDPRGGSPGMRLQTFCEPTFELRVLVDAFATYRYVAVARSPELAIVAGPPERFVAVLPTLRRVGEEFTLGVKGEDGWGNPSDRCAASFRLRATRAITGLPERLEIEPGRFSVTIHGLAVDDSGDVEVELIADDGTVAARSNPLRIVERSTLTTYWGDLHGQSEETIGTNSAQDWFEFARDRAFLDVACHQGNDFQITTPFWEHLNELTSRFDDAGRFIAIPGYEWSGNTGLGGDRNVLYRHEGGPLLRSSHALVDDLADVATDANTAADLFAALEHRDCVVFAHVGGRYADIDIAHDQGLERSVEVHSAWGTFEWLLHDALRLGYRVGIVANSDGHKGRPGASYPGASTFGSYGGLTAVLATELSRDAVLDALRRRHHYATTGARLHLDLRAVLDGGEELMMGDVVTDAVGSARILVDVSAAAAIERVDVFDGLTLLETVRPYERTDLGSRVRVVWEGAEYRGRGRETVWDGAARLLDNRFVRVAPFNHYNLAKRFDAGADEVSWESLTTGGHAGFDAWLVSGHAGTLQIRTQLVSCDLVLADVGDEDRVFDAGGLGRRLRIFRLPEVNPHRRMRFERTIPIGAGRDTALYVRVTLEDGHLAWTSPIYLSSEGTR